MQFRFENLLIVHAARARRNSATVRLSTVFANAIEVSHVGSPRARDDGADYYEFITMVGIKYNMTQEMILEG